MRTIEMLLCLFLVACETAGPRTFRNLGWARVSVDQASAECYAHIAANPLVSFYQCMKAKGWEEQ